LQDISNQDVREIRSGKVPNYPVAETVFVIPAPHRVRDKLQRESSFFALDPCFRRGDIVGFCFPQQKLINYIVLDFHG